MRLPGFIQQVEILDTEEAPCGAGQFLTLHRLTVVNTYSDGTLSPHYTNVGGDIMWIPVDDALKMCEQGKIVDMKTELGLRRLASG